MTDKVKAHMALVEEAMQIAREGQYDPSQAYAAVEASALALQAAPAMTQPNIAALMALVDRLVREYWEDGSDKARAAVETAAHALAGGAEQAVPVISTKHGPWIPSKYSAEEGEKYCQRCLMRDKFFGAKDCTPHIMSAAPSPSAVQPLSEAQQAEPGREDWGPGPHEAHGITKEPRA